MNKIPVRKSGFYVKESLTGNICRFTDYNFAKPVENGLLSYSTKDILINFKNSFALGVKKSLAGK
ncbi:hypothetical protein DDT91_11740 [Algoriphagus sp. AK58]|nr:hypothetical protein [Algoriphagus sp. AK58]